MSMQMVCHNEEEKECVIFTQHLLHTLGTIIYMCIWDSNLVYLQMKKLFGEGDWWLSYQASLQTLDQHLHISFS